MTKLENYNDTIFESIKHTDENGSEYWYARELMIVLEYGKWENFHKVIKKAMLACKLSNNSISCDFPGVRKIVEAGATTKEVEDYKLSRYACYLIVHNADVRKEVVAFGQTYFAVQTRKMELTEDYFKSLDENKKRLITRGKTIAKNKTLYKTVKESGVVNYGKFTNCGYKGLYGGETAKDIARRKGIDEKKEILDYMGSEELADNLFRIVQTESKLKNDNIDNEVDANNTHYTVGKEVRDTIKRLGGIMPEDLPTPDKSINEIELEEMNKLNVG